MLDKIGINIPALSFQIINFLILVWILKKYLYSPILKTLSSRQKQIEEGLKLKEEMEVEKENLQQEKERILKDAEEEAQLYMNQIKKKAEKTKQKILQQARQEKESIIEQGKKAIEARKQELDRRVQKDAAVLAQIMAKKALNSILSQEDQRKLIQSRIKQLSKLT